METLTAMLRRCRDPRDPSYPSYGGRGIRVCAGLETIEGLIGTIGERPIDPTLPPTSRRKYMTIDRIAGPDSHYTCGTCDECVAAGDATNVRWATASEQAAPGRRRSPVRRPESYDWARSRTACHRGHEYVEGVSYRIVQGARRCLLCERDREARRGPRASRAAMGGA